MKFNNNAQATLEFAIFFPLFALVIAMIIQFSWILLSKQRVEMAAFRGALYAANPENFGGDSTDYIKENVAKKFFPFKQQDTIVVKSKQKKGPDEQGIDYAELSVRAEVKVLALLQPFARIMWVPIASASENKAVVMANKVLSLNSDAKTIATAGEIRDCHDSYSGGIYRICAYHKVAYDPNVRFSKE